MTSSRADTPSSSRVRRVLAVAVAVVVGGLACGGSQRTPDDKVGNEAPREPPPDTRTAIEKRRDTACDQLGPKLTLCAVEDARAELTAGKITRAELDSNTEPGVQRKHTEEFLKACKGTTYSSRQVRVLEVCFRDAPDCGPLIDCLGHLDEGATKGAKP